MHCNHPECDCTETPVERNGKSYCSEACATGVAQAARASSTGCGCGHAGCGATETVEIPKGGVERQSLHAQGGNGNGSFRAGAPGESAGLRGDGLVGDAGQRAAERPGRNQPDDSRRMGVSGSGSSEDAAGAAMKPGAAVQQRGLEAPGKEDGRSVAAGSMDDPDRSSVHRGATKRGVGASAPGRRDP